MPAKILLPPEGKHGSAIVGVNGRLRVVDPPRRCKGYVNGCKCKDCQARTRMMAPTHPLGCKCSTPLVNTETNSCIKCGRPSSQPARAAA